MRPLAQSNGYHARSLAVEEPGQRVKRTRSREQSARSRPRSGPHHTRAAVMNFRQRQKPPRLSGILGRFREDSLAG